MGNISQEEKDAEEDVKNEYYKQDKKEYAEKVQADQATGGKNPPAVPKSMLQKDYNKNSDGSYTIKSSRHKEYR